MDRALASPAGGLRVVPLLILGLLPGAILVHDIALRADPNAALWSMPLPVVAALLCLTATAMQGGRIASLHAHDPIGRNLARAALGLALLAGLLVALRAQNPLYGLIRLAELGLVAAAALALGAWVRGGDPGAPRALARAFIVGTAAALPLMALARWQGWPPGYGPLDLPGFTHIRILGFPLATGLAAACALWTVEPPRARAALFAAMVLMTTALFWSGGRGALLALALPLPVLALLLPRLRPGLLPTGLALGLGAALALLFQTDVQELGLASRLGAGSTSADALSSGRLALWRTLLDAMSEAPLLGHGLAQSHWIFAEAGHRVAHVHAHNIVLDAGLALGWPGAAALAALTLVTCLRWLSRARRNGNPFHAAGLAMVAVFLAFAMVDGIYVYWQGLLPLALGVALLTPTRPA